VKTLAEDDLMEELERLRAEHAERLKKPIKGENQDADITGVPPSSQSGPVSGGNVYHQTSSRIDSCTDSAGCGAEAVLHSEQSRSGGSDVPQRDGGVLHAAGDIRPVARAHNELPETEEIRLRGEDPV
jgi:hypothetical protein